MQHQLETDRCEYHEIKQSLLSSPARGELVMHVPMSPEWVGGASREVMAAVQRMSQENNSFRLLTISLLNCASTHLQTLMAILGPIVR